MLKVSPMAAIFRFEGYVVYRVVQDGHILWQEMVANDLPKECHEQATRRMVEEQNSLWEADNDGRL